MNTSDTGLAAALAGLSTQAGAWYNAIAFNQPVNTVTTSTGGYSGITLSTTVIILLLIVAVVLVILLR
jgi:hypothetical protein